MSTFPREGARYTEEEKELLDWISKKIIDPQEMTSIAPAIAKVFERGEGAIRHQIENRKRDSGDNSFFFRNT